MRRERKATYRIVSPTGQSHDITLTDAEGRDLTEHLRSIRLLVVAGAPARLELEFLEARERRPDEPEGPVYRLRTGKIVKRALHSARFDLTVEAIEFPS